MKKEDAEQLLRRYLDNKATPSERGKVEQLYQQLLEETDWKLDEQALEKTGNLLQQKLQQRLNISINSSQNAGRINEDMPVIPPRGGTIPFFRRSIIRYAGAAILILSGTCAWWMLNKRTNTSVIAAKTVIPANFPPGGNKALLTLSDGSTIMLDSAANGVLSRQGGVQVIKLDNGRIAYQGKETNAGEMLFNTMSTPRGGQYQLSLPDGTRVWLNAASSITYPTAFTSQERNVSISGEAYFEVAKDSKRPFLVKANNTTITVMGTHFNINSYEDEPAVRTTLLEGSVKVNTGADSAILQPGQQAASSLIKKQKLALTLHANVEQVMAWKNGYFNFKQADLPAFMRQLERWYDIEVKYEGNIHVRVFQGKLQRELNLSEILAVLEQLKIKYRFEGKTLIVSQ